MFTYAPFVAALRSFSLCLRLGVPAMDVRSLPSGKMKLRQKRPESILPTISCSRLSWRRSIAGHRRWPLLHIISAFWTRAKFDFNYSVEILIMVVFGRHGLHHGLHRGGHRAHASCRKLLRVLPGDLANYRMLLYSVVLDHASCCSRPTGLLGRSMNSPQLTWWKISRQIPTATKPSARQKRRRDR